MAELKSLTLNDVKYDSFVDRTARENGEVVAKKLPHIETNKANIEQLSTQLAVERERINSLTRLGEGSTTGDAELQDIRVGYNGAVHETAGEAVRAIGARVHDALSQNIDLFEVKIVPGRIDGRNGALSNSTAYNSTDYIDVSLFRGNRLSVTSMIVGDIGFAVYDETKTYIAGYCSNNTPALVLDTKNPQSYTFDAPESARYVRFTMLPTHSISDYPMSAQMGNIADAITSVVQVKLAEITTEVDVIAEQTQQIQGAVGEVQNALDAAFYATFDLSSAGIVPGRINAKTGVHWASTAYNSTDYIDVSLFRGNRLSVTSMIVGDIGFAVYDGAKTYIAGYCSDNTPELVLDVKNQQSYTFDVPESARYVRFTMLPTHSISDYPMVGQFSNVGASLQDITSELDDARTGNDGTKYETVGEAVRGQAARMQGQFDAKLDKREYTEIFDVSGNVLPVEQFFGQSFTSSGVTITVDASRGIFTLNGTATAGGSVEIIERGTEYGTILAGNTYLAQIKYISGECTDIDNNKTFLYIGNITGRSLKSPWVTKENSNVSTNELAEDIVLNRFAISYSKGATYTDFKVAPYLALASDFDEEYSGGSFKFCVSNLDTDIEEAIDEKIASLDIEVEGQLVGYMKDEAVRVNSEAVTEEVDINFLAFADPHLFDADKYKKYAEIMGLGGVDFMVGLGDYAPYAMSERKTRIADLTHYLSLAGRGKDCFYVVGNHEDDTTFDGGHLTKKELHRCLCSHLNGVAHFNEADPYSCYYYVDYSVAKIRVIILNTSDMYSEAGEYTNPNNTSFMMHQRQLTWFAEAALNFKEKTSPSEWSVLVFGHTCFPFSGTPIPTILQAVKNGTKFSKAWTVGEHTLSVNADYSTQGAVDVIGMIMGHSHNDVSEKLKDVNCIQLRCDNGTLDIPYTASVDGLAAGAYFITADNAKKYGCNISESYPAAKFISYNYSTVSVSGFASFGMLILDENKLKLGEVTFTEAAYNGNMTELTGFVAQRVEGTATTESCYIINVNKDSRTITAVPYGVGCDGVIATY